VIRLTTKGKSIVNAVRTVSLNELKAMQSIEFEEIKNANDLKLISGLPDTGELMARLRSKGLVEG